VTLDPEVDARLREESEQSEVPMTRIINRALRKLFAMPKQRARQSDRQPAA
jgi:hypothetical protein